MYVIYNYLTYIISILFNQLEFINYKYNLYIVKYISFNIMLMNDILHKQLKWHH